MSERWVLRALTVRRFRHLVEPAELVFGDAPVVLVGLNGSGKSNLLALIDAIVRFDYRELDDGFPFDFTATLDNSTDTLTLSFRWSGSGEVGVEMGGNSYLFRRFHFFGAEGGQAVLAQTIAHIRSPPFGRVQSAPRLDEALERFWELVNPSDVALVVPDGAWRVPAGLVERVVDTQPERRRDPIQGLPWLEVARRACGFDTLEIELSGPTEREGPGGRIERAYTPFTFYARQGRARFHHRSFSFGQKRILAACWTIACVRPGAFVADELVNGLHHDAVAAVLDLMGPGQAFFASQNPLLFDHLELASAEDARTRIVRCERRPGGWSWSQPDPTVSERLFASYEAGFQHVSELLRAEGLW